MENNVGSSIENISYRNIVLDPEFNDYHFKNPLPVYVYIGFNQRVGMATLKKVGAALYCDLILINTINYNAYFPYAPFNIYGQIQFLVLTLPESKGGDINNLGTYFINGNNHKLS